MPRQTDFEEDWDDEGDYVHDEDADEYQPDDDSDDDTILCPHCREPIYEGAERCPHCEKYLSLEDEPAGQRPTWIYVGALVCLVIVIVWIVGC